MEKSDLLLSVISLKSTLNPLCTNNSKNTIFRTRFEYSIEFQQQVKISNNKTGNTFFILMIKHLQETMQENSRMEICQLKCDHGRSLQIFD